MGGSHVDRVLDLTDAGERRYLAGDRAGAITDFQQACEVVRGVLAGGRQDPADLQQLGSMLYKLGEWLREAKQFEAAAEALEEAESAYGSLGDHARMLVADVVLRRARVLAEAGRPFSAVAAVQQAVLLAHADLHRHPRDDAVMLGTARVAAFAGSVQLVLGCDPELAVNAAYWASAVYSTLGAKAPRNHGSALAAISQVLAVAPRVGRADRGSAPSGPDGVAVGVTLAQALDSLRDSKATADLKATLTGDRENLVSALRGSPQLAPIYATQLTELLPAADGQFRRRLALEAHAMFASASQQQIPTMRYQFGDFGRTWSTAVLDLGKQEADEGDLAAAIDAAAWLTGIANQLGPHVFVDRRVRATVLEGARWQATVHAAAGDRSAVERVEQVISNLDGLP